MSNHWLRHYNFAMLALYLLLNLNQDFNHGFHKFTSEIESPLQIALSSFGGAGSKSSSSPGGSTTGGDRNLQTNHIITPSGIKSEEGQDDSTALAAATKKDMEAYKKSTITLPLPVQANNRPTLPPPSSSEFAYVFFLGGIPSSPESLDRDDEQLSSIQKKKEGLLYNILVSVKILKESGSIADMVLLIHTVGAANATLPINQQAMLRKLGIKLVYTPNNLGLDPTNFFGTVALEKFRIFDWHQYKRILFMDADIMPHCNLDYLFHQSRNGTALKENVLISMDEEPASSNFFLIKPVQGRYGKFLQMITSLPTHWKHQNRLEIPRAEWISLYQQMSSSVKKSGSVTIRWNFAGLNSDLGLLYYFMRFLICDEDKISLIVGGVAYTLSGKLHNHRGIQMLGPYYLNPLPLQSRLPPNITSQDYQFQITPYQRRCLSPIGVSPYQDIAMWKYDKVKPWELLPGYSWEGKEATSGAPKRWLQVLSELDQQYQLGIGLVLNQRESGALVVVQQHHSQENHVRKFAAPATTNGSDIESGAYSSTIIHPWRQKSSSIIPLGLISHHAVVVWAKQQLMQVAQNNTKTVSRNTTIVQMEEPALPTAPSSSPQQKRAFVCVTGQLERLELQNKIEKLFVPIMQRGYQLDVALVVTDSDGQGVFTNHDMSFHKQSEAPFYANFSKAVQDLTDKGIHVLSSKAYKLVKDPPFHQKYFERLHANQKLVRSAENQRERVLNHARIFDSYTKCFQYARQQAQQAMAILQTTTATVVHSTKEIAVGSKEEVEQQERTHHQHSSPNIKDYYDVFMRIRDDVGLENALPNEVLSSLLQPSPGSVLVTGCRSWSGMNDRFASVSPDVAETYFTRLYQNFLSGEISDSVAKVYNPETYLFSTFAGSGIHVLANRDLIGLSKIIMDDEGRPMFAPNDIEFPICFLNDPHLDHTIDLYGWIF